METSGSVKQVWSWALGDGWRITGYGHMDPVTLALHEPESPL